MNTQGMTNLISISSTIFFFLPFLASEILVVDKVL